MSKLNELKKLHCQMVKSKHPNLPDAAITSANYKSNTANGLTKAIVAYITLSGGWATRVYSTGRMVAKGKTEVGSNGMKWIPGTTKKGTADIHAVWKGRHLSIEVKIGRDKQSAAQKAVEADITRSGGVYYCAKDFDSFYTWINTL